MEFIKKIFTKDFLLDRAPSSDIHAHIPVLIVCGILIVLAIGFLLIFRKLNPIANQIKGKITTYLVSAGSVGALLTFFRWQQLGFLSKNITAAVLAAIWLIWLVTILSYIIRQYPKEIFNYREQLRIKKYLPKPKRRNH